jgi:hypothetical protein
MTKEEHKNAIAAQINQQTMANLMESLACAFSEIETLKARIAELEAPKIVGVAGDTATG